MGLEPSSYEVTAPQNRCTLWAISSSSRQIIRKASQPVPLRVRPKPRWPTHIIAVRMKEHVTLTQREQTRLQVLNSLMADHMTTEQAATLMGVSARHTRRILAAYRRGRRSRTRSRQSRSQTGQRYIEPVGDRRGGPGADPIRGSQPHAPERAAEDLFYPPGIRHAHPSRRRRLNDGAVALTPAQASALQWLDVMPEPVITSGGPGSGKTGEAVARLAERCKASPFREATALAPTPAPAATSPAGASSRGAVQLSGCALRRDPG